MPTDATPRVDRTRKGVATPVLEDEDEDDDEDDWESRESAQTTDAGKPMLPFQRYSH